MSNKTANDGGKTSINCLMLMRLIEGPFCPVIPGSTVQVKIYLVKI